MAPDGRNLLLNRGAWRYVVIFEGRPDKVRLRELQAVHFPTRCQRQGLQHHKDGRYHGSGDLLLEKVAQFPHRGPWLLGWDDVSNETRLSRDILTSDNGRLSYRRMLCQCGLNLPQFDADATKFHLLVQTAHILQMAIWLIAHQIAGLIEARPRLVAEEVWDKTLGSQFRRVQITPRQASAPNIQFAGNANRYRLQV